VLCVSLTPCVILLPTDRSVETPIGYVPTQGAIDTNGLTDLDTETMQELFTVDTAEWKAETARSRAFFANFKERLPAAISSELDKLDARLDKK
jgi:phosphoenolpyruvate carboxykinase (GTP)